MFSISASADTPTVYLDTHYNNISVEEAVYLTAHLSPPHQAKWENWEVEGTENYFAIQPVDGAGAIFFYEAGDFEVHYHVYTTSHEGAVSNTLSIHVDEEEMGSCLPRAELTATPSSILAGQEVRLNAAMSYCYNEQGYIYAYAFDFDGDDTYDYWETEGGAEDGTFNGVTTHTYTTPGTYHPKVWLVGNYYGYDFYAYKTTTVTVYPTTVYVDKNATGANNGNNWANAYTELRSALNHLPGTQIWVAEGTYTPDVPNGDRNKSFQLKDGMIMWGGFSPQNGVDEFLERNGKKYETILSGDLNGNDIEGVSSTKTDNSRNVVKGANNAIIEGFTITSGYADSSPSTSGGGMYNNAVSQRVQCCTFKNNYAWSGGAVYNNNAPSTFWYCVFANNEVAMQGGGMVDYQSNSTLVNCLFYGNKANWGAAIVNYNSNEFITNCTFYSNTAVVSGGGLYNLYSNPVITNSIFWCNTDAYSNIAEAQIKVSGGSPAVAYCCIQDNDPGDSSIPFDDPPGSSHNIDDDPLFADGTDPAGPDGIYATEDDGLNLHEGSPCINAGNNSAVPPGIIYDIAGDLRIADGTVDMGAYEFYIDSDIETEIEGLTPIAVSERYYNLPFGTRTARSTSSK